MLKGFAQYQQIWCFGFIAKVLLFNWVCMCVHTCACVSVHTGQKRTSDPLKLELQMVVSRLTWVLGPKLWTCKRVVGSLHCWIISPGPLLLLFVKT